MKRYTILLTLLFALMNMGCDDTDDTPAYIDCEWAYYWTGAGNIVYVNSIPSINATFKWKAIWIHYFNDDNRLEYKKDDGSIKIVDLTGQINFQYQAI